MLWLALRFPQLALDVFGSEVPTPEVPISGEPDKDASPSEPIDTKANTTANAGEVKKNTLTKPPLLVFQNIRGSKKVLHSNDTAEALGVRKAMSLVTAEALLQASLEEQAQQEAEPHFLPGRPYYCFERDPSREWVALQQLAALCYDFTPHVSVHNPPTLGPNSASVSAIDAGLLLEVSGSLKLFKGLARLCQLLQAQLQPWGCFVQLGIGPTPEGAWLLSQSRYLPGDDYSAQDYLEQLGHIDLGKIDCFTEAFGQLNKMGLRQLHQVLAMPMVELGRRFGEPFIVYLQALTGKKNAVLMRRAEACEFHSRVQLNHPVVDLLQLQPVVTSLLQQLSQFLRREQHQCEAIAWQLRSATGEQKIIPVVCQPVHSDWQLLQQLTAIHFEHLQLDFEIDSVELVLTQHSPFNQETGDLFASDPELALNQQEVLRRWQLLLTRLHNRLGNDSTLQLTLQPEHWPEQLNQWHSSRIQGHAQKQMAEKKTLAVTGETAAASQVAEPPAQYQASLFDDEVTEASAPLAPRPSWLINPPVQLNERGHQLFWRGPLTLLLGPERLQGQWWLPGDNQCRDYFIAEQDDYRRVWIYHDHRQKQWFLQGVFG